MARTNQAKSTKARATKSKGAAPALVDPMLTRAVTLLGGRKALGTVRTTTDLVGQIRDGIPASSVDALASALAAKPTPITRGELLTSIGLAKRTADRKKAQDAKLDSVHSDRLVRVARIIVRAEDVLGNMQKATSWLASSNRSLGGQRPIDVLDTQIGSEQVEDVLTRIEFGVYG